MTIQRCSFTLSVSWFSLSQFLEDFWQTSIWENSSIFLTKLITDLKKKLIKQCILIIHLDMVLAIIVATIFVYHLFGNKNGKNNHPALLHML
jgi:hypothetical protein